MSECVPLLTHPRYKKRIIQQSTLTVEFSSHCWYLIGTPNEERKELFNIVLGRLGRFEDPSRHQGM